MTRDQEIDLSGDLHALGIQAFAIYLMAQGLRPIRRRLGPTPIRSRMPPCRWSIG